MMSSQLGRVILGGSDATSDEMNATPDESGGYGTLDGLLEFVAERVRSRFDKERAAAGEPVVD